jgi:hypothetical protein
MPCCERFTDNKQWIARRQQKNTLKKHENRKHSPTFVIFDLLSLNILPCNLKISQMKENNCLVLVFIVSDWRGLSWKIIHLKFYRIPK